MVARPGMTRPELAERYGVTERVVGHWTHEEGWPAPIGKRGRWQEYDSEQTDAAVAARAGREQPEEVAELGDRLLTMPEIAELYSVAASTIRDYASKGQFGEPDDVSGDVKQFRADRVAEAMSKKRKYTKKTPDPGAPVGS